MSISSFLFLQSPFLSYENLLKPPLKHHPVFCPLYLCIVVTKMCIRDRYIIIGLGNYGHVLAEELSALGHEVIGADVSAGRVDSLKEKICLLYTSLVREAREGEGAAETRGTDGLCRGGRNGYRSEEHTSELQSQR